MSRPCQLERAFELARSGQCQSVDDIKKKLLYEGLGTEQIDGPVLRRQLRDAIADACFVSPNRT